ncbi:MAG TPA: HAD family hydrolase [Trueperaceae bacterium]
MYRAVCFDLDGTLAEYHGDFDELLDSVRTDLGLLACDFTTFRDWLADELRRDGKVTLGDALASTLEGLEQRVPADLEQVTERAIAAYVSELQLREGARDLLDYLAKRRVPLALISNGPSDMQRAAVRELGLEGYFATLVISGDEGVGRRKPAPAVFELACRRLGVTPARALMIGDDPVNDLSGAKALGMATLDASGSLGRVKEHLVERWTAAAS